jgi:transcriptional regulator with XRE-family HTH domain
MKNIGEMLKSIRLKKGISSSELEILSGITQPTISKIENNIHSPSIETLIKLCAALDTSVIHFFDDNEEIPVDMINLIDTAKKLSPNQRQKITEMIESFIVKK